MKFKEYLSTIHSVLEKSNPKRYVIGNSSADFDSIFGSLIYAFFLTSQLGQTYLPIIDCNKTDIPLRFDVNFIMKRLNIDYHKLLYTSDIDYLDKQNIFYLYDHNHRQQVNISQIVDHHAFHQTQTSPQLYNRIIYPTGSALTLLYYLLNPKFLSFQQVNFKSAFQLYLQKYVEKEIQQDSVIEQIIRHGVLIDCFGFDEKQKQRWTEADKFLLKNIQKSKNFDLSYDDLSDLKFNDQMNLQLTLQQHLRRDYKVYNYNQIGKVEYSIICLSPDLFLKNYGQKIIQKFQYAEYDVYMFMFIWIKSPKTNQKAAEFGRQALFSINNLIASQRRDQIINSIQKVFKNLNLVQEKAFNKWYRWNDPSATVSRKKVDKFFRIENAKEEL